MAFSIVSPTFAARPRTTWWQKHGAKVKAGIAIAALVGAAIGLAYHGNKTKKAVEEAGITMDDPEAYANAIAIVGLLGPLGPDKTIKLLEAALKREVISPNFAVYVVFDDVGKALANYYGINVTAFRIQAGTAGIKGVVTAGWEQLKQEVGQGISNLKPFAKGFFTSK
jgi:hypothetical protein